jgi:hypothetical protein
VATTASAGTAALAGIVGGMRRVERPLRVVAARLLIVAGLHDTLVSWLL